MVLTCTLKKLEMGTKLTTGMHFKTIMQTKAIKIQDV